MQKTFTEAYKAAGFTLRNPRNQWSSRRDSDGRIALTVWADEIDKSAEPWVVDTRCHERFDEWGGRQGNAIRRRHIAQAIADNVLEVELILCVAEDPNESPRRVKSARHWHQRVGRLDAASFDAETGQFRLELHAAKET